MQIKLRFPYFKKKINFVAKNDTRRLEKKGLKLFVTLHVSKMLKGILEEKILRTSNKCRNDN